MPFKLISILFDKIDPLFVGDCDFHSNIKEIRCSVQKVEISNRIKFLRQFLFTGATFDAA